jgi:iron complex outermembrane receptor protein
MSKRSTSLIGAAVALALSGQAAPAYSAAASTDGSGDIEEVIVSGIRGSLRESIDTKREATGVVDALTAEDVGKFPDKNLAEALQRVPGIVVNREFGEGERISVRGTSPNLTKTLLNGHSVATADWFVLEQLAATRTFNYLVMPSEIIGQVVVNKSSQADFEEGGIGATIDVHTRDPLDLDAGTINLSGQAAYTDLADEYDPQASGLFSWKNQDETLGFLVAAVYQERNIRRDGVEVLGYLNHDTDPTAGVNNVLVPSLIGSALFEQERIRQGGNIAVQFRPSESLEINLTGLYTKFDADNSNANFLAWGQNALGGGGTLTNVTMQGDTAVAGTITSANGGTTGRAVVYDTFVRDASATTTNIDADITFRPNDDWTLHFDVGYTDADGDTSKQLLAEMGQSGSFTYDLRGRSPQVSFSLDPTNPAAMNYDFGNNNEILNDDKETYAYVDIEKAMDAGMLKSLKFGAKFTDHEREAIFNATTYGAFFAPMNQHGCNGGPCSSSFFAAGPTPGDFLDAIDANGTLTRYWLVDKGLVEATYDANFTGRIPYPPQNFSIKEKSYAGYVMANLGGDRWRGNVGVRVVNTDQTSKGNQIGVPNPEVSSPFGDYTPVTVDRSYTDVLPSLNLAYDVKEDIVLRFAAAKTMTRPDFVDIAPRITLNPGALTANGGDPETDPYRATQFDLSAEWYPGPDMAFAVAVFYKDLTSFITDDVTTRMLPVTTANPITACTPIDVSQQLYNCPFTVNQRTNNEGRITGFEVGATMPIGGGFGFQTNYTFSDSEANDGDPIPGASEDQFNLSGYFENDRLSARLSYTYRSDFFVTFDRSTQLNQKALESVDLSVVFNVLDSLALTFDAINLTDDKIEQYATETFRPRAIYDNGRTYYGGVRLKF